jgi:hypothetical protein
MPVIDAKIQHQIVYSGCLTVDELCFTKSHVLGGQLPGACDFKEGLRTGLSSCDQASYRLPTTIVLLHTRLLQPRTGGSLD